jgi:membrane-bound metal-dependent hydrolase YbcI (DUF457 family)
VPDAVTHLLTARLAGTALARPEWRAVFYLGVLWPDLLNRGVAFCLAPPEGFGTASHSIVGLIVACAGAALLFRPAHRVSAFALLMGGSLLHLAADLLKDPGVFAGVPLLFPFVEGGFSLGLFRSEDSAYAMPVAALAIGAIELVAWRRARRGA